MSQNTMVPDDVLKRALEPSPGCPPLEVLAAAMELGHDHPARRRTEQHLAVCPACRVHLQRAAEFASGVPAKNESEAIAWITEQLEKDVLPSVAASSASRQVKPSIFSWLPPARLLAPAGLAFAALAMVIVLGAHHDHALTIDESGPEQFRAGGITLNGPQGDLHSPPSAFEWQPFAGAASYELRIMEVDGAAVYRASGAASSVVIPSEITRKFVPFKTLHWMVIAKAVDGREISTSQTGVFRVRP